MESCGEMEGFIENTSITPGLRSETTTQIVRPHEALATLPVDFLPVHVSLASVLVMALLIGWDTRRDGGGPGGSHRRF